MDLTQEQHAIINSTGNIKINAVAGSGKTTTLIEYAATRPKDSKILYLAFNRSVKTEAQRKFTEKGLLNVKVETAHSLAYKRIVYLHDYKVRPQGYKTYEIAELLGLKGNGEKHAEFIVANHISKFITYFCNSEKPKVQDLNYLDVVSDNKAKAFVKTFYDYIENQTRLLLNKMDKGEIEITHDFYLKKFQMLNPELYYDYILFDEGQDASSAMLDIFLKQKAVKVIVGDTHQQIYSWRYAVNSLEKTDFKTYHLSTSFRFSQDIANLAVDILKWKNYLGNHKKVTITGKGDHKGSKTKAVLARTNLGLLLKSIEYSSKNEKVKHIYFEGNINSYTYAEDGASLYDVLNLFNHKRHLIRDNLVKKMSDLNELDEYAKKSEDSQIGMLIEIVKEYGNSIPGILSEIKEKHVSDENKDKAQIIFSTVHRCKGMEYDAVQLVGDFITEEKLKKSTIDMGDDKLLKSKLNEEINLLYVAVTRTKNILNIPSQLLPKEIPDSPRIYVIEQDLEDKKAEPSAFDYRNRKSSLETTKSTTKAPKKKQKSDTMYRIKEKHKSAYSPWTQDLDRELTAMYNKKRKISEIARFFDRTPGAIKSRIKKLEL
jgi:F-box protein, helicase, 18